MILAHLQYLFLYLHNFFVNIHWNCLLIHRICFKIHQNQRRVLQEFVLVGNIHRIQWKVTVEYDHSSNYRSIFMQARRINISVEYVCDLQKSFQGQSSKISIFPDLVSKKYLIIHLNIASGSRFKKFPSLFSTQTDLILAQDVNRVTGQQCV